MQLGTNFGELELRDDFKFVYRRREAIGRVVGFHLKVDNLEKEIIPCVKTAIYTLSHTGELVLHTEQLFEIQLGWITGVANVSSSRASGTLYCARVITESGETDFNPDAHKAKRELIYEGSESLDRTSTVFLSMFYDGYTAAPTRYQSVGGLYLTIMNMALREQRKLENVFLLCLVPHNANFVQVWERYRKELIALKTKGFDCYNPKNGKLENKKARLGLMKADSPQRVDNSDHVGGNADLFCPRCNCRKLDIWDIDFPICKHHYPPGFLDAVILLKGELTPEDFQGVKKRYGFFGKYDMFRGLSFYPGRQMPAEPYHLWILGILRFFFKRIIKNVLKPYQRDQVNFMCAEFKYPRGMPSIRFDVTSSTKNFSMSLLQQISIPFLYSLNLFNVDSRIVRFWADLDQFVRDIFEPAILFREVPELQERGTRLLKIGKEIIPKVTEKEPHNIHAALEYLFTDLPVFLVAQIMAGIAEEHKHQPFKNGAHFTSGGVASCTQLTERDVLVSTLRYLLHGGSFGEGDKLQLHREFRELRHPDNNFAPHPLLETLTDYLPNPNGDMKQDPFPSKFFYSKACKTKEKRLLAVEEVTFFAEQFNLSPSSISEVALPSRRYTIDASSNFEVGDVCSLLSGHEHDG